MTHMKALLRKGLPALMVLFCLFGMAPTNSVIADGTISFSIVSTIPNQSVTILTYNFPANQLFTVRMAAYGSNGLDGTVVAVTNTGAGGSYQETYAIPANLSGVSSILIRMDSESGYSAENWFSNTSSGWQNPQPSYSWQYPYYYNYWGNPTFSIESVVQNQTVTILTNNLPPYQSFTARMGPYGSAGLGGYEAGTINSGGGGSVRVTFTIPPQLYGYATIAIRLDSPGGYYAYNWFYNNSTGGYWYATPVPYSYQPYTPYQPYDPYQSYWQKPTFSIQSVVPNQSVTIVTYNFPANEMFTVRMGAYGTAAVGGIVVGTFSSAGGGTLSASFPIPSNFWGSYQIAIRMDSPNNYYAYNWFYNN